MSLEEKLNTMLKRSQPDSAEISHESPRRGGDQRMEGPFLKLCMVLVGVLIAIVCAFPKQVLQYVNRFLGALWFPVHEMETQSEASGIEASEIADVELTMEEEDPLFQPLK